MSRETWFERHAEVSLESPTLVEGLPGHGMVASIAVDQITEQLAMEHHSSIHAENMPNVTTFEDGRVRDLVRVYGGSNLLTLQSDVPIPSVAFDGLSTCIFEDLADSIDRGVFLAGIPAQDEEQHGTVTGVATTEEIAGELEAAGIELMSGAGIIGGVTGALVQACHHRDVPAATLLVQANPYFPDPAAARELIENALEPLVDFDIDSSELQEQAAEIRHQKQQIAAQLEQQHQSQSTTPQTRSMFQ